MRLGAGVVGALCVTLALWCAPAGAAFELGSECNAGAGIGQFLGPEGIAIGPSSAIYVADTGNNRVQRFTPEGAWQGFWGSYGIGNGQFDWPSGIAVDPAGNVYVAESFNNRVQKFTASGTFLLKFGTQGSGAGQFFVPVGVATDQLGNVYVVDSGNHRVQKFNSAGALITTWGTGPGAGNGQFSSPAGIAVDFAGNVYVADTGNHRIQKFDSNGGFITAWGALGSEPGSFNLPFGVGVDNAGAVFVADQMNHRMQHFTSNGTFLDQFGSQGSAAGQFEGPGGMVVDAPGNLYVLDIGNNRVQKFPVDKGAVVVRKDAQTNDAQDLDFTAGGGLAPPAFQLDDDGDECNGLSSHRTFTVDPGSGYSVAEVVPSGWTLASSTCSDGSAPSSIAVSAREIVTCTFVNHKPGRIVVVQDSQPDDPQDFGFAAGPELTPATFTLDDDGNSANGVSNTQVLDNVTVGSGYSVTQTSSGGWHPADVTCSDGSSPTNIDVGPGETVTCTFSNLAPGFGRLTVVKDTEPDDPRIFGFTLEGTPSPVHFPLNDDAGGTDATPRSRTFTLASGPSYLVREAVPGDHDLISATCTDGSPVSGIDLASGEHVTCTFVNLAGGLIEVMKDTQPDDPRSFSFAFTGDGPPRSFALSDGGTEYLYVPTGSGYSITEATVNGWRLQSATCSDGSPVTNVNVSPHEIITCTFTNTKAFHIHPESAGQLDVSLVPAFQRCVEPNRMHGPPLSHPSCSPPVHHSGLVTPGGETAATARFSGRVRLDVIPGQTGAPDEADVRISFLMRNLRRTSSGSDYAGELRASFALRLTDTAPPWRGPQIRDSSTVQDFVYGFTVPCAATGDPLLGGECRLLTTADALQPGLVVEGNRAVWDLNQVEVRDGGLDEDGDTAGDNSLLAVQGVFVP